MSYHQTPLVQTVTNPFQASAFILFNPKPVFDALFLRDNWSWVPFLMLSVVLFMPAFLFFKVVDFDYWISVFAQIQLPNGSPKEQQNFAAGYLPMQMQYTMATLAVVVPLFINLVLAGYYSVMTRNDEKCIQGFSDWFGAMWWCAMPALVSGLIAIGLISLYEPNVQTFGGAMTPLSLTFFLGLEPISHWFEVLKVVRIDAIWSVYLGSVLLRSWTEFSATKAITVASIPYIAAVVSQITFIAL